MFTLNGRTDKNKEKEAGNGPFLKLVSNLPQSQSDEFLTRRFSRIQLKLNLMHKFNIKFVKH